MKFFCLLVVLVFGFTTSYAHSCANLAGLPDKEHREKLDEIASIFYGEVVTTSDLSSQSYRISFKVLRVWKGDTVNEITVRFSNPCGDPQIAVGTKMMVYAHASGDGPMLEVNCCSRFDDERMKRDFGEGIGIPQPTPADAKSEEGFFESLWKRIVSFFSG